MAGFGQEAWLHGWDLRSGPPDRPVGGGDGFQAIPPGLSVQIRLPTAAQRGVPGVFQRKTPRYPACLSTTGPISHPAGAWRRRESAWADHMPKPPAVRLRSAQPRSPTQGICSTGPAPWVPQPFSRATAPVGVGTPNPTRQVVQPPPTPPRQAARPPTTAPYGPPNCRFLRVVNEGPPIPGYLP